MNDLDKWEINFLADNFFKLEDLPGSVSIARNLLKNGKCIVAGDKNIRVGGVGNFIKVDDISSDAAYGCVEYTLDLNSFLTSNFVQDTLENYKKTLEGRKKEIDKGIDKISNLCAFKIYK